VEWRANAEAGIRGRGTAVCYFFASPPLSEKRRTKSAKPWKRQEDPGVPFMMGEMPERVSSYGGEAILRGETEERSCSERKKVSRINLERRVGPQLKKTKAGDQSSRKLLQNNRKQEIDHKGAPNSLERSTFSERP